MFQMYKVALSAGKAHRDHKHHHVHKFVHNGPAPETTPAPPTAVILFGYKNRLLVQLSLSLLGPQRTSPKPSPRQRPNP